MPCLILTGHPCSGKTRVANALRERAAVHPTIRQTIVISEDTACPDQTKSACYADSQAEKFTRGALKSAFDRQVGKSSSENKDLIILDSTNYIKGFRYELYCISKAAQESHGIVWILNDPNECCEWNRKRKEGGYTEDQMRELIQRYEPPDERNRWDRPLYRIYVGTSSSLKTASSPSDNDDAALSALDKSVYNMHQLSDVIGNTRVSQAPPVHSSGSNELVPKKIVKSAFKRSAFKRQAAVAPPTTTSDVSLSAPLDTTVSTQKMATKSVQNHVMNSATSERKLTFDEQIDQILDSFLNNVKPLQEGTSTRQNVASDANVLHAVDSITQQVCVAVNAAQSKAGFGPTGGKLLVGVYDGEVLFVNLTRRMPLTELRRLRRQYLQWVATHLPEDTSEGGIRKSFVGYMEAQR